MAREEPHKHFQDMELLTKAVVTKDNPKFSVLYLNDGNETGRQALMTVLKKTNH